MPRGDLVVGGLTVQTRFGVMHGKTSGPLSQSQEEVMQAPRSSYNMKQNTKHDSDQAAVLTPEFIDEYAIIGMPDRIIERLQALKKIGIEKIVLGGTRDRRNRSGQRAGPCRDAV